MKSLKSIIQSTMITKQDKKYLIIALIVAIAALILDGIFQ
jgi:hypothetical protein